MNVHPDSLNVDPLVCVAGRRVCAADAGRTMKIHMACGILRDKPPSDKHTLDVCLRHQRQKAR